MQFPNVHQCVKRLRYATPLVVVFIMFPLLLRLCISLGAFSNGLVRFWASMNLLLGIAGALPFILALGAGRMERRGFKLAQISASVAVLFFLQSSIMFEDGPLARRILQCIVAFQPSERTVILNHDIYFDLVNFGGIVALLLALLFVVKDILTLANDLDCDSVSEYGRYFLYGILALIVLSLIVLCFSMSAVDDFSRGSYTSEFYGERKYGAVGWMLKLFSWGLSLGLAAWVACFVYYLKQVGEMLADAKLKSTDRFLGASVRADAKLDDSDWNSPEARGAASEKDWDDAMQGCDPEAYDRMMRQMERRALECAAASNSRHGAAIDLEDESYSPWRDASRENRNKTKSVRNEGKE